MKLVLPTEYCCGFRVQGLGFGVWGLGFGAQLLCRI
jgi:hypothetical protein